MPVHVLPFPVFPGDVPELIDLCGCLQLLFYFQVSAFGFTIGAMSDADTLLLLMSESWPVILRTFAACAILRISGSPASLPAAQKVYDSRHDEHTMAYAVDERISTKNRIRRFLTA